MTVSEKNVSWFQINNIVPIIVTFIAMTLSYGALMTRVSVLENKVDTLLINQEKMLAKYSNVEDRYGQLALKINTLEGKIK